MQQRKKKQSMENVRRAAYSWPMIVFLGIVAASMLVAVWNIYQKSLITKGNLDETTAMFDELSIREADLMAGVDSLETEFGVEAEIRDKFGLVREGEEVVVVIDGDAEKGENVEVVEKKGWLKRLLDIF
jgi:hypothetical protein